MQICQILHPAPEERLQTVTEIKKSHLFDGVYVTLVITPSILLMFLKRDWKRMARREIHPPFLPQPLWEG